MRLPTMFRSFLVGLTFLVGLAGPAGQAIVADVAQQATGVSVPQLGLVQASAVQQAMIGAIPSHTYATLDPANKTASVTLSGNNLVATGTNASAWGTVRSTISKTSGKWYVEATVTTAVASSTYIGSGYIGNTLLTANFDAQYADVYQYGDSGQACNTNSCSAGGASYTTAAVIGIAIDATAGSIKFYKNNVLQFTEASLAFTNYGITLSTQNGVVITMNFGATAMAYPPPAGYNAGLYNN